MMKAVLLPSALLVALQLPVSSSAAADKIHHSTRATGSHHTGVASYYSKPQRLASGGRFKPSAMTAAHKTLPFGTRVRVTHARNGRSVDVRINDRGPFVAGRIIDLSKAAAQAIGMGGTARVKMTVLGR
jgi:peptidoglycan lytic transglycosylase